MIRNKILATTYFEHTWCRSISSYISSVKISLLALVRKIWECRSFHQHACRECCSIKRTAITKPTNMASTVLTIWFDFVDSNRLKNHWLIKPISNMRQSKQYLKAISPNLEEIGCVLAPGEWSEIFFVDSNIRYV